MAMNANTVVVEEKEKDTFSVKQITKLSEEIADFHIRSNHDWKRCIIGLVVNVNLENRRKIFSRADLRVM
jgi:hypothetical protein